MNKIIIGCGGHARSIADVILDNDINTSLIFLDDNAKQNEHIMGYPVYNTENLNKTISITPYIIGIGSNSERMKMYTLLENMSLESKIESVISLKSYVSKLSKIENGVYIAQGTHIGPMAYIGHSSIINTGSIIEHETHIGKFTHIAPQSIICGRCNIGDNVFVGAGSVVKDYISICDNVTIGAGSVVIKDIINPGTYVGNPAHVLER